jgi:hypothetical protein
MEFLLPMKLKDHVEPSDSCLLVEKVTDSIKGAKSTLGSFFFKKS